MLGFKMNDQNKQNTIVIPALNIEKGIESICSELISLSIAAEAVTVWNSVKVISLLPRIRKKHIGLRNEYEKKIVYCHEKLTSTVTGPGITMAFMQTWNTSLSLSAILKLQHHFTELGQIIDRKYSYSMAIFALYIAIISLIATVSLGILTL